MITSTILSWSCTPEECHAFSRMAKRAHALNKGHTIQGYMMDLEACHCNECRLDIAKLEAAPAFDFAHDVFGIVNHLNRETGRLERCFWPRCAAQQEEVLS